MTDRLALLRAALARPTDNTPRLVYADWLDDHAGSDADAARAELIRLWFKLKPNMRSTTRELARWLGANWRRLWPHVAAAADRGDEGVRAQGRVLGGRLGWQAAHRGVSMTGFKAYFDRGFAEVVQFEERWGYERFWEPFARDEPLAEFEPLRPPHTFRTGPTGGAEVRDVDWGADVFDRLTGHVRGESETGEGGIRRKFYAEPPGGYAPLRALVAVSAAMTARARAATGLGDGDPG